MRGVFWDTAIVGAGLAGTVVAASLARLADDNYRAVLFEPRIPGRGTAYAAPSDRLLMNGPVRAMSAMPGDDRHLAKWLGTSVSVDQLIPRNRFGEYLIDTLIGSLTAHPGFGMQRTTIVDIERIDGGWILHDAAGAEHRARNIVLAVGNHAPDERSLPQALRGHGGYVSDPWQFDARTQTGREIALIGSGLTAMDVVALLDERGYEGTIHLISRHGLLPAVENPLAHGLDPATIGLDASTPATLVRSMRRAAREHASRGGDWRDVAESIRKDTPDIWARWSIRQRKQFLRHLQSFWAVHRYRTPSDTAKAYDRFNAQGRIVRHRGHVRDARPLDDGRLQISLSSARGSVSLIVSSVINCTGPNCDYANLPNPLVRNLIARGIMRPDGLRLGIDATPDFEVIDGLGVANHNLFTLGPPLRGLLYETTAVPETRDQAARIARRLIDNRSQPSALDAVS